MAIQMIDVRSLDNQAKLTALHTKDRLMYYFVFKPSNNEVEAANLLTLMQSGWGPTKPIMVAVDLESLPNVTR
jgi:hypothetical protein